LRIRKQCNSTVMAVGILGIDERDPVERSPIP